MKKILFILFILTILTSVLTAQDIYDSRLLTKIGLSQEEIEEIQEIQFQMEQKIKVYNADLNILKAQLGKLLLNENPDMDEVKNTIQKTVRLRSQTEIARVEARVQTRQKIGNESWNKMLKLQAQLRQIQRLQENTSSQNRISPNNGSGQFNNDGSPNPRN